MRNLAPKSGATNTAPCEPTFTPGDPLAALASLSVVAERQRLERAAAPVPVDEPSVKPSKPRRSKARKKKVEKSEGAPLPSPPRGWFVVGDDIEAELARTWSDRACVCQ